MSKGLLLLHVIQMDHVLAKLIPLVRNAVNAFLVSLDSLNATEVRILWTIRKLILLHSTNKLKIFQLVAAVALDHILRHVLQLECVHASLIFLEVNVLLAKLGIMAIQLATV